MRKLIAMICAGLLTGVFVLNAQDDSKQAPNRNNPALGRGGNPGRAMQMVTEYLRENDPKKFEEMKKLRQENPDEFKKQMADLSEKIKEKFQKEREEFKALVEKYRETKSDADKAALKGKLEEMMNKGIEMQKRRVEEMEKNITQMKSRITDEEKNMQAKIEERLAQILSGKEVRNEKKPEPAK